MAKAPIWERPPTLSGNDNDYEKPTRYSAVLVEELTAIPHWLWLPSDLVRLPFEW